MKVKDFIENLKKFDDNLEVKITDGFNYLFYEENSQYTYQFGEFEGFVDIGIGGTRSDK